LREAILGQTLPFSLAGVPAISIPTLKADGMPLGLQIVGAAGHDARLLQIADWLQSISV
jgi:aspartyl-tRNA(Asn)/glutamyl-tRNA(Gln) amidotransferase subunit A